jgi:hypothetical protein
VVQNDISMFERVERSNHHVTSAALAVKKFTRIVDDCQPEQVRTRGALQRTMEYLCTAVLDTKDFTFGQVRKNIRPPLVVSIRDPLNVAGMFTECSLNVL